MFAMESTKEFLKECCLIKKPGAEPATFIYDELLNNSDRFPINFPIQTTRCKNLREDVPESTLQENIAFTYPLIHEKVLPLLCKFLLYKRKHGSVKEQELYKNMGIEAFVERLLLKRSVVFCGPRDFYHLINGETGMFGWQEVGTNNEKAPLLLKDCLSYHEMKLSAMLYVSGPTVFINDGSRINMGVVTSDINSIERFGIIIGLIGPRLPVRNVMEFQEMLINKEQNTYSNGYGSKKKTGLFQKYDQSNFLWRDIWAEFYNVPSLTYEDAFNLYHEEDSKVENKLAKGFVYDRETFFDNNVYSQHISIAFDCALLEANKRGSNQGKTAYLHIVGIGLGVWRAFKHQDNIFVKTFLERIKFLAHQLTCVSDVHFSYMKDINEELLSESGMVIESTGHPCGGIKVHLSNRQPSSKLTGESEGKLLVETYAWDGNAQPGNEFWDGSLQSSGDPAAACSSQIAELHNSHINKRFVCGKNLHIAGKSGIQHISEYVKNLL